jgi:hypothetical protein
MKTLLYTRECIDGPEWAVLDILDVECRTIELLTPKFLYNWVKANSINIVTPRGGCNYYVARFEFGKFSLSLQVGYYLWSKRNDDTLSFSNMDNSVMTKAEWDALFPSVRSTLDVQVEYGKEVIVEPTQLNFIQLVNELQRMVAINNNI